MQDFVTTEYNLFLQTLTANVLKNAIGVTPGPNPEFVPGPEPTQTNSSQFIPADAKAANSPLRILQRLIARADEKQIRTREGLSEQEIQILDKLTEKEIEELIFRVNNK